MPPKSCVLNTSAVECWLIPNFNWQSIHILINTQLISPLLHGQHLSQLLLAVNKLSHTYHGVLSDAMYIWVTSHSVDSQMNVDQVSIECWPSVNRVLTEYWSRCRSSVVKCGSRVAIDTWVQMSLEHMILKFFVHKALRNTKCLAQEYILKAWQGLNPDLLT